jgi:hypothetical protein
VAVVMLKELPIPVILCGVEMDVKSEALAELYCG